MSVSRKATTVEIGPLTRSAVVAVARGGEPVVFSEQALAAIAKSRALIDGLAGDVSAHYGVSTGFGALATTHIPADAGRACNAT